MALGRVGRIRSKGLMGVREWLGLGLSGRRRDVL